MPDKDNGVPPQHATKQPQKRPNLWNSFALYCEAGYSKLREYYRRYNKPVASFLGVVWHYLTCRKFANDASWTTIFTGLIFVGSIFYSYFAFQQWQATKDSVDAAREAATVAKDSLVKAERPWIKLTIDEPTLAPDKPVSCQVFFTNLGKTPAKHVWSFFTIEMVDNGNSPNFFGRPKFLGDSFFVGKPRTLYRQASATIFPGDDPRQTSFTVTWGQEEGVKPGEQVPPRILSKGEYQEAFDGLVYFAIYSWVIYDDEFHIFHWTQACDRILPINPTPHSVTAGECTQYNDTDSN